MQHDSSLGCEALYVSDFCALPSSGFRAIATLLVSEPLQRGEAEDTGFAHRLQGSAEQLAAGQEPRQRPAAEYSLVRPAALLEFAKPKLEAMRFSVTDLIHLHSTGLGRI